MKKFFLVIALCFGIMAGYAQEEKSAAEITNEGNDALRVKDFTKALNLYEQAISKMSEAPQDTAMYYHMAYSAYQIKSFDKAIKYFDESIKLDYKKETAFLYKANSYKMMKDEDGYVKTLEEALTDSPDNAKVKSMLAIVYLKQANVFYTNGAKILKDAAADVTASKYKTTDPQYKDAEGKAKEEFKKALPVVDKALSFDPENATAKQLKAACEQTIKG